MRFRLAFAALSVLACGSWLMTQGCGGDDTTTTDASDDTTGGDVNPPPPDSGKDVVTPPDSGGDGSTTDGGGGDGGTDGSSTGLTFSCGTDGGTVTDCAQCTGATQPCVFCETADASVLSGACTQFHNSCFGLAPNGFGNCGCTTAADCPEGYQVCRAFGNNHSCRTCSESNNNNGLTCENAGTCDYADGGCI
jgi:hypothetical protein